MYNLFCVYLRSSLNSAKNYLITVDHFARAALHEEQYACQNDNLRNQFAL